jgi:hypothetical protein
MSEEKKYEDHHIILTMEHEMKIDGHYLTEKIKQTSLIESLNPESIGDQTIVREQIRSINDKFYKVTKIKDGQNDDTSEEKRIETIENVETDMTDEEIKQFEEDWTKLWNPEVTKKEIQKLYQ